MNRVIIDHTNADDFVADQVSKNSDVSWDGWDLLFYSANPNGFNDKNGVFKNGQWGVQARVVVSDDGLWKIPAKYIGTRRKVS